jgi:hypothetical protein
LAALAAFGALGAALRPVVFFVEGASAGATAGACGATGVAAGVSSELSAAGES